MAAVTSIGTSLRRARSKPAARSFYEKCGFTLEGTQRHAVYRDGRFVDVHLMSILRDEWQALERKRSWDYRAEAAEAS